MGMWDVDPWDNDAAADFFGNLMDTTKLREEWLKGITADPDDDAETVRAAAWLFLQLGRVYVWPVSTLDEDLALTVTALTKVREESELMEVEGMAEAIDAELQELESRR